VAYYQRVYFGYPDTDAAVRAAAAIVLLKNAMGAKYPPPAPEQILKRGDRWLAAREYKQARQEFASMVADLGGLERDQARVRIGAADYLRGETPAAFRYLQSLNVGRSEADAERLYYLAECQRRMNDHDDMVVTVQRLSQDYPASPWRLKALVSAANSYLVENRPDIYEPLYTAAYQDFPNDTTAAYSHWKVAWSDYIRRRPEAGKSCVRRSSSISAAPMTGAAMYFLGRLSEKDKDFGTARLLRENRFAISEFLLRCARAAAPGGAETGGGGAIGQGGASSERHRLSGAPRFRRSRPFLDHAAAH
jgi:TolA-binding protein